MVKETEAVYRIHDLEPSERPRERLAQVGPGALSSAELLAILLRTGLPGENAVQVGQRLLNDLGGLAGLHRTSYMNLCRQNGVGPAKAAQIQAAIELGKRLANLAPEEKRTIHSPADAADLVRYEMSALEQEELRVILLDVRNQVIGNALTLYRGSATSSQVRVAEVFKAAVQHNATNLIVVHNHPSGDPTPSPDDIAITRNMVQAGKILDINVLDHLIIGQGRWFSLKERGLGFS
jgi:DNA repair protein RadC